MKRLFRSLAKIILLVIAVLTVPIWLPLAIIGFATEVIFLPGEWAFRRKMTRAGRAMGIAELERALAEGSGSLVVEWPTLGFAFTHLWWTADELTEAPTQEPAVSVFVHRHTDPASGDAKLIAVWNGQRVAGRLIEKFPSARMVRFSPFVIPDEVVPAGINSGEKIVASESTGSDH